MSTSKFVLLVDFTVAVFLTVAVTVGAFLGRDMSPAVAVTACWDGQLGIAVGFYYWKAKNENRSKYAMKLVKQLAKEYGIENVIQLAQTVLKD